MNISIFNGDFSTDEDFNQLYNEIDILPKKDKIIILKNNRSINVFTMLTEGIFKISDLIIGEYYKNISIICNDYETFIRYLFFLMRREKYLKKKDNTLIKLIPPLSEILIHDVLKLIKSWNDINLCNFSIYTKPQNKITYVSTELDTDEVSLSLEEIGMKSSEEIFKTIFTQKYIAVNFHCGNIDIFSDIISLYSSFFAKKNLIVFVSCHSEDVKTKILNLLKNARVNVISNIGADIGGFLTNIKSIIESLEYKMIEKIYFIHTKTKQEWRNQMIAPILKNDLSEILDNNNPTIIGSNKYRYKNNKMINRHYIKDIISRNNLNINIEDYSDTYIYDINDMILNNGKFFDRNSLITNPEFYKRYEDDLNFMDNEMAKKHWINSGINEFHRIKNPCYVSKYGKTSYFIAGTIFAGNRSFLEIFEKINLEYEFSILECGYNVNNVPRKVHSWEYLFGLICESMGGNVIGIDEDGSTNSIDSSLIFSPDIYKKCNIDLQKLNETQLINHYNEYKDKENRIFCEKKLQRRQCIVNKNIGDSKVAFFLIISRNNISGGYRTLLRYINHLTKNGISVDLYFGESSFDQNTCFGYSVVNDTIENIVSLVDSYGEINVKDYNFFLGLNCQKWYSVVVANAWQISNAVYDNRIMSDKIAYIIQDEEYLFYPNNKDLQNQVKSTYKKDFSYFCVTSYLSKKFLNMGFNVNGSFLGVDTETYYDKKSNRKNEIVIAYYKNKPGRCPELIREIVSILSKKYVCNVFPDDINKDNVINHGKLEISELNDLYNNCKVGIVFSNTNPSRLGFEMIASGLKLIEYDCEFTSYDLKDCIKIKDSKNILEIVESEIIDFNKDQKTEIKSINEELSNLLTFFEKMLSL
uniref:Uncharacterized protein n=1 Tax=viral metagenome TaxID=1070528 RepID=A0A6C0BCW1_9ZZZZ